MSSISFGDKYTIELEVNGTVMKLDMAHTHTITLPKIVVFTASLEYWIVNLLVVVTEFSAALIAVIEVWTHQCVKAKQEEGSLKSRGKC